MALTALEKDQLRMMICSKGTVTPDLLKSYANKSDDILRSEILIWKTSKLSLLELRKSKIQEEIDIVGGV